MKKSSCLVARSCLTLCEPMDCSTPGFPVHHYLLEFAQTQVCWVGDAIHPSCPLLSPFPPAFNLSQHQGLSNELALCIRWPQYWSFSFSIRLSNKYSELTSFKIDWFDLLAVQGTFKSLLQHHRSKASILWHYAFFMVQLSHPYITPGKTIALTIQTFVGKVFKLKIKDTSLLSVSLSPTSAAIPPWNMPLRLRECLELEERLCITWKALIISHLFRLS